MNRCYSELIRIPTFEERLKYLQTTMNVGDTTFGGRRLINQEFYRSREWKRFRYSIIVRDGGCDLAIPDRLIDGMVIIHHINPLTIEMFVNNDYSSMFDPENVILTSDRTHRAIHYRISEEPNLPEERYPFDTCPWRIPN